MTAPIYLALVHHPVVNKRGVEVTTSVTNLDIHDIARTCRTYGLAGYFIVTPIEAQHQLLKRITDHWESDEGGEYNPDRSDALSLIRPVRSVEEAMEWVEQKEGKKPLMAVTGAGFKDTDGTPGQLKQKIVLDAQPLLLLFGTGWGLSASLVKRADYRLTPLVGAAADGYNHLSVRSAVAIYCDRLAEASDPKNTSGGR